MKPSLCLLLIASTASAQSLPVEEAALRKSKPSATFGSELAARDGVAIVLDEARTRLYIYERDAGGPGSWGQVAVHSYSSSVYEEVGVDGGVAALLLRDELRVFERDAGGPGNWGLASVVDLGPASGVDGLTVHGDTIFLRAFNNAMVLERDLGGPGNWGLAMRLFDDPALGPPLTIFPHAMDVQGDVLVLTGIANVDDTYLAGADVFERTPNGWVPTQKIFGGQSGGRATASPTTAVWGDTILLRSLEGVHVFERGAGGTWSEAEVLGAESKTQAFGNQLEVFEDTILVADRLVFPGIGGVSGVVHAFERDPATASWERRGPFFPRGVNTSALFRFGRSLAMDGPTILAGHEGSTLPGAVYLFDAEPAMGVNRNFVSESAGGTALLRLDGDAGLAGSPFLVLGSASGTTGVQVGGFTIPLDVDAYFSSTLFYPGNTPIPGSYGFLDGNGDATVEFVLPPASGLFTAGTALHHAWVAFDPGLAFVSNPVTFDVVP